MSRPAGIAALVPRCIPLAEVAAIVGAPEWVVNDLAREHVLPGPMAGTDVWDRKALMFAIGRALIQPNGRVDAGYVYFFQMGKFIKIGFSMGVESRRRELQASSPYDITNLLSVPGSMDEEAKAHGLFSHARYRGEWFRRTRGLLAYIEWHKSIAGAGKNPR